MWVGIALLIELAAFTLWKRWYWFFPSYSVSELYTKYAGTEGLDVAFVKDYRVNDTVFVDVTMLETKDSLMWDSLKKDFKIMDIPKELEEQLKNNNSVEYIMIPKYCVIEKNSTENMKDICAFSRQNKTICVFHIYNKEKKRAIIKTKIKEL